MLKIRNLPSHKTKRCPGFFSSLSYKALPINRQRAGTPSLDFSMCIAILALVITLTVWSLHLMQQAIDRREFSLMLAGTLVAFSAAALVGVNLLVGNYMGFLTAQAHQADIPRYSTTVSMSDLMVPLMPDALTE
jgi:hypothetical protein